jgi:putative hydrolases of HD superfamily
MKHDELTKIVYEAGTVKRIKRTGWQILGGHEESVGEHTFMTSVISYFLGKMLRADLLTVLTMAIFHDFHEARTGEVDKLAKFYITRDQNRANLDIFQSIDPQLLDLLNSYEEKQTIESRIVYEANVVAFLVEVKILVERGHTQATEWFMGNRTRVKIPEAVALVDAVWKTDSQIWWKEFRDELNESFINE